MDTKNICKGLWKWTDRWRQWNTHHRRLHCGRGAYLVFCFPRPSVTDQRVMSEHTVMKWRASSCSDMHTASVTRDCPVETRVHLAYQIQQSTSLPKNITIILTIPRKNVLEDKCSCVAGTISPTSLIHSASSSTTGRAVHGLGKAPEDASKTKGRWAL